MTVYVWRSWYEKPRVQHLPQTPIFITPDFANSLCGELLWSAEYHQRIRRDYTPSRTRHRLTSIDYDQLPICRRCAQKASKA